MLRKMTAREIYRCATAYHKLKSRQIVEALYTDFTSWEGLLDFAPTVRAPNGSTIALTKDPAMIIGVAQFQGTDVAIIAQQTPPSVQERSAYNYGLTQADGYGLALCMMDYAEKYGLTTRMVVPDLGGWGNSRQSLIDAGVVECYFPCNHREPFATMEPGARDMKSAQGPACLLRIDALGLVERRKILFLRARRLGLRPAPRGAKPRVDRVMQKAVAAGDRMTANARARRS